MKYLVIGVTALLLYALTAHAETIVYEAPVEEIIKEKTIEEKIREIFPEDPDTALAIAKCESNLNPLAISHTNDGGIFQINWIHDTRLAKLGLDKFNVDDNLKFARILYDERKWLPWTCFKKIRNAL